MKKREKAEKLVNDVISNSEKAGVANTREYQSAIFGEVGGEVWSVYFSGIIELGMTKKQARLHAIDYLMKYKFI